MATALAAELRRALRLAYAGRGELLNTPAFFVLVVLLFPLGIGPDADLMGPVAPGLLWITALLASLLSVENVFRRDFEDGTLDALVQSDSLLFLRILVRVGVHWLFTGLPIVLLGPLLGATLAIPERALGVLTLGLLLGTPTLALFGCLGAALTVSLRRSGLLVSLLVLPLYIPVLIFGVSAVLLAVQHLQASGPLFWLATMTVGAATLIPFAIGAALRIAVES